MEGVILLSAESPLEATSAFNKKILDKRFKSEKISTENKYLNRQKKKQFFEKARETNRDMHIANIPTSAQWGTEISILIGLVGVILLGKLLNYAIKILV